MLKSFSKNRLIPLTLLGSAVFLMFGGIFASDALFSSVFATSTSGNVQLNAEVATAIAMKIASPNDTNPECMAQSGVTYGEANRYATSNGMEGSKQVDTFDGTEGGADEINTNTSCAMLTMNPNAYDSTYSDVTVYTNSGNGYALTLEAAEPNLVNTTDNTQYIPAGTLVESNNTVAGGQNAWSYKTDNGIITSWTPVSSTAATIKAYDQETSGGDTTRVTYGISSGNNPAGKYATTLTYTATMFDEVNPYAPTIDLADIMAQSGATITGDALRNNKLTVPYKATRSLTVTPDEGYYLKTFTCPTGFTCSAVSTGSASNPSAASRAAQTVSITNDSVTGSVAEGLSISAANTYRISFSNSNVTTKNTSGTTISYIDVQYGRSAAVTVAPASGYYLSSFSGCPSGWTCSGVSTGASYTGSQTLTLRNNKSVNNGTIVLAGTSLPVCSSSTTTGTVCRNSSTDSTPMIKLKDSHFWTASSRGTAQWSSAASLCPSGTHLPSASEFDQLLAYYDGSAYSGWPPYGYRADSATFYNATGWANGFWSSTEQAINTSNAWYLSASTSYAWVIATSKTNSANVICLR